MAGGVSSTVGALTSGVGAFALVFGLFLAVSNLDELGDESRKFVPNEAVLASAAAQAAGGVAAAGVGLVLLFVGVPFLVYALHREWDPVASRTVTRHGGVLRAWGVSFAVLAAVSLSVGAFAAGYGAGIVEEEFGRQVPHEPRAEAGAYLAVTGAVLFAVGVALALLSVPFLVGGAARAVRQARARPAADGRTPWGPGQTALGVVGAFLVLGLLLGVAFGQGTTGGAFALLAADDARPGETPRVVEATLNGTLRGAHAPGLGAMGTGEERREHVLTPSTLSGTVEVVGGWEAVVPTAGLVVVVEAQDGSGAWKELVRQETKEEVLVATALVPLYGDVRITLELPSGSGGELRYVVVARIIPQ